MLSFLVGSKQAFEVSLADVSQTQLQGTNDVMLEFHADNTTGANEVDSYSVFLLLRFLSYRHKFNFFFLSLNSFSDDSSRVISS